MTITRIDITELTDQAIVCRTVGHSWEDNPNGEVSGDFASASTGILMLRCTRCTTERYDYIGKAMDVFYRRYVYPARYKGVVGQGTRPNLRGEMLRRSLLIHGYTQRKKRAS